MFGVCKCSAIFDWRIKCLQCAGIIYHLNKLKCLLHIRSTGSLNPERELWLNRGKSANFPVYISYPQEDRIELWFWEILFSSYLFLINISCFEMLHRTWYLCNPCNIMTWLATGIDSVNERNLPRFELDMSSGAVHACHTNPRCSSPIFHNALFCNRNVPVHCGISFWCLVGFVGLVYYIF